MEPPPVLRHVREQARRLEALAVARAQPLQDLDREAGAEVVEVAERAAQEGREAQAEDGPHVAVARRAEDTLLEAQHGLVQEREDQPLLDLARLERPARRAALEERVHGLVHALLAVVDVEPALVLATLAALVEH